MSGCGTSVHDGFPSSLGFAPAVGDEQRRAVPRQSAQPRTAACDCTPLSEAGAFLAWRLPIQQRAMTGTGLRAFRERVRGQGSGANAINAPSVSRQLQPRLAVVVPALASSSGRWGSGQLGVRRGLFAWPANAPLRGSIAAGRPAA